MLLQAVKNIFDQRGKNMDEKLSKVNEVAFDKKGDILYEDDLVPAD